MRIRFTSIGASCAVALACMTSAAAQAPAGSVVVVNPTYTFIPMEIDVDRPAGGGGHRLLGEDVERVLRDVGGNTTRAAEILGISRKSLWQRRKRYDGD